MSRFNHGDIVYVKELQYFIDTYGNDLKSDHPQGWNDEKDEVCGTCVIIVSEFFNAYVDPVKELIGYKVYSEVLRSHFHFMEDDLTTLHSALPKPTKAFKIKRKVVEVI